MTDKIKGYHFASKRGWDWNVFSIQVWKHIENYTVPQYGDRGEDQISEYSAADCMTQVKKYAARFGNNARPGQELLDIIKLVHYAQCAYDKLAVELKTKPEPDPQPNFFIDG